jgi:hypothetical protein
MPEMKLKKNKIAITKAIEVLIVLSLLPIFTCMVLGIGDLNKCKTFFKKSGTLV